MPERELLPIVVIAERWAVPPTILLSRISQWNRTHRRHAIYPVIRAGERLYDLKELRERVYFVNRSVSAGVRAANAKRFGRPR